jgi:hypothetical protein
MRGPALFALTSAARRSAAALASRSVAGDA